MERNSIPLDLEVLAEPGKNAWPNPASPGDAACTCWIGFSISRPEQLSRRTKNNPFPDIHTRCRSWRYRKTQPGATLAAMQQATVLHELEKTRVLNDAMNEALEKARMEQAQRGH